MPVVITPQSVRIVIGQRLRADLGFARSLIHDTESGMLIECDVRKARIKRKAYDIDGLVFDHKRVLSVIGERPHDLVDS